MSFKKPKQILLFKGIWKSWLFLDRSAVYHVAKKANVIAFSLRQVKKILKPLSNIQSNEHYMGSLSLSIGNPTCKQQQIDYFESSV